MGTLREWRDDPRPSYLAVHRGHRGRSALAVDGRGRALPRPPRETDLARPPIKASSMKLQRLVKSVSAKLDLLRFPAPPVRAVSACCLHCSSPLALHQPDPDSPERLLGVCEQCKHWFLIDLRSEQSEGVMVRLPDTDVIRHLSHENPSAGISLMNHEPDPGSAPEEG